MPVNCAKLLTLWVLITYLKIRQGEKALSLISYFRFRANNTCSNI